MNSDYWNNYIYTDQKTVIEELKKRRQDTELQKKVENFWGKLNPSFLKDVNTPLGFFARPLATPNMEMNFFLDIVGDFGVTPLIMEFPDRFITINKAKYHLGKPHFFFKSRGGRTVTEKKSIINFNEYDGKLITEILTTDGIKLSEYHHEWLYKEHPELRGNIIDVTEWFDLTRKDFSEYYAGFLALGLYHGVIFENFLFNDARELDFFLQKVEPSFERIKSEFGLKPLISPILPVASAELDKWYHYPKRI